MSVQKHVLFEVEMHGAQVNREAEVIHNSNNDVVDAQRQLEVRKLEEKINNLLKYEDQLHLGPNLGYTFWKLE